MPIIIIKKGYLQGSLVKKTNTHLSEGIIAQVTELSHMYSKQMTFLRMC